MLPRIGILNLKYCKVRCILKKFNCSSDCCIKLAWLSVSVTKKVDKNLFNKVLFFNIVLFAGCSVDVEWCGFGKDKQVYLDLKINPVLAELYQKHAASFGVQFPPRNVQESMRVGSTDMANVSHAIPSIHPVYSIPSKAANHTKEFTESSGDLGAQLPTLIAAKAMAMTTIDVFCNPQLLENLKKAFKEQQ